MTSPVASARPKTARTLAALAATAIVGALSPVALAAPAAAAPADAACPEGFGATAASNTLALGRIDLRATGLSNAVLPEMRVATTHSGVAGGTLRAAADARYLRSSGDLPAGVLGPRAYQQAPPSHDQPDVVNVNGVDLGALRLGTGGLRGQASWKNAGRCTTADGPRAASSATLAGITVLPGRNGRALLRINAVESATVTGVGSAGGRPAATAAATGGIADFKLLDNGPSAIGVRVISPPSLNVLAGAKKTVDYTAPVLEITVPGQAPVRVSSAGSHVDVVVPVDAASTEAATDLARTENLPVLSGLPLVDLLTGITTAVSGTLAGAGAVVPGADLNSLLGALPGLPAVGGLLGSSAVPAAPAATEGASAAAPARVVVLRVELGSVEKQFSSTGVYAKAASVRVKLISRNTWKSTGGYGHGGSGPADKTSLIDLGICTLETAAAAPKAPGTPGSTTGPGDDSDGGYGPDDDSDGDDDGYGHHGGGTGNGNTGGGGGGSASGLPVTGNNVALMLGGGVLLVVAGRLLQILARRRSAA